MAEHRDRLNDIFEDLDKTDFAKFQWQLRNQGKVKRSVLDDANRMNTIDAMVGAYDDTVLEVTREILQKIQRNDLAKKLSGTVAGSSGSAAALQKVPVTTEATKKLKHVRSAFIEGISQANLHCLLDKLLDRDVINDDEMEDIRMERLKVDKARRIIDMVRKKGEGPSSEMIYELRRVDPNLCENMGL